MKKLLLLILLISGSFQMFSQTPGISYQAVILNPQVKELPGANAQTSILANSNIVIRFTIIDAFGNNEYQEYQKTTTDPYGMINLLIGSGTVLSSNNFNDIVWDGSTKKLKVEIDFSGTQNNYSLLNEQELTFMPQPVTGAFAESILNNTQNIEIEKNRATGEELALRFLIEGNKTETDASILANSDALAREVIRATAAETTNATAISDETTRAAAAEATNATAISDETTRATAAEATLTTNVAANTTAISDEVTRAIAAEITNATAISDETTRAAAAEATNATAISDETTRATAAEATLSTNVAANTTAISDEVTRAIAAEITNATAISDETTRATAAEATLTTNVAANTTAISDEVTRATAAETTNATAISDETTRATAAESTLTTNVAANTTAVSDEVTRATAAETTNATAISDETTRATAAEATLTTNVAANTTAISDEVTRATVAETINATAISDETTRATAAESTLTTDLAAEVTNRTSADLLKEDKANKSTDVATDGASDIKYPSVKSVKTYVDNSVNSKVSDAIVDGELTTAPSQNAVFDALALKAPLSSPTFTGTVNGIDKTMVGLANVDNTSDANKPVSTATQTALDLKANLDSPTFTGTPTLPTGTIATTQTAGNNTTAIATTAFVTNAISGNFVDLTTNQTVAGTKTFSSDAVINGITVGRGNFNENSNTAIGLGALGSNAGYANTGIGRGALAANVSSGGNTALGYIALSNNVSGSDNVAIGTQTLGTNVSGSENTAIGKLADVASDGISNSVAIGANAIVTASNTIQLGSDGSGSHTAITDVKTSGAITAASYIKSGGTSSEYLMADGSVSTGAAPVREVADEFSATAAQTSFTLSQTPSVNSKVKMYINGIRISNTAYSVSGVTLTYTPANNGGYALTVNDRIQFDFYY